VRVTWRHFAALYGACAAVVVLGVFLSHWTPLVASVAVAGPAGASSAFDLKEGVRYTVYLDGCIPPNDPYELNVTVVATGDGFVEVRSDRLLGGRRTSDDDCGRHLVLATFSAQRDGAHELRFLAPGNSAVRPVTLRLVEAYVDPDVAQWILVGGMLAGLLGALYQTRTWRGRTIPKETGLRRFAKEIGDGDEADQAPAPSADRARPLTISFPPLWSFTDRREFSQLVITADGRRVLAGANPMTNSGDEPALFVLDVETGAAQTIMPSAPGLGPMRGGEVASVSGSADGRLIAAALGKAVIVCGPDGKVVWIAQWRRGPGGIIMNADGTLVLAIGPGLVAYGSGGRHLWGREAPEDAACLAMNHDGTLIALAQKDGKLLLLDRNGKETARPQLPASVTSVAVSGDGSRVLALMPHHGVAMLDSRGAMLWLHENHDGAYLATLSHDGGLAFVDTLDGAVVALDGDGRKVDWEGLEAHMLPTFSTDGRLAALMGDNTITMTRVVRDLSTGDEPLE
jgi:outer membrane protein assembly factor BamB